MAFVSRYFSATAALLGALSIALMMATGAAQASTLDSLRASGALGEGANGYLIVRDSGNAAAVDFAQSVNAKRKSIYQQRADKEGVSADDVGRVFAPEILNDAPGGTWYQDSQGKWNQK
ncbi:YdbL family protein [Kiloniella sp. b19]|uniref:YdbL family protein n=1 Tax=Kiloniella sp. GXU_MW_B19 TaxID=3141326 RepID=UPI0031D4EE86